MSNKELPYKCEHPNCRGVSKHAVAELFILVPSTVPEGVPFLPFPTICPPAVILPENL
jgi:hypothetical protein